MIFEALFPICRQQHPPPRIQSTRISWNTRLPQDIERDFTRGLWLEHNFNIYFSLFYFFILPQFALTFLFVLYIFLYPSILHSMSPFSTWA